MKKRGVVRDLAYALARAVLDTSDAQIVRHEKHRILVIALPNLTQRDYDRMNKLASAALKGYVTRLNQEKK